MAAASTATVGLVEAFAPATAGTTATRRTTLSAATTTTTPIRTNKPQQENNSKKKKKDANGGGIPLQPAGNRHLFDPATDGYLADESLSDLNERLQLGAAFQPRATGVSAAAYSAASSTSSGYLSPTTTAATGVPPQGQTLEPAQHWLEDTETTVPPVFAKASAPVEATVLSRTRLIGPNAEGDISHIVLQLPDGFRYVEGQSISVIPPGLDDKTNKKHKPRLYSIASTRYGDDGKGNTVSLCVRHAQYRDPATGQVDDSKQGVCSTFLCKEAQPGQTTVAVAGPVGKTMLLPDAAQLADPATDLIMVATGTGIAPFRGFLRRLFIENTVARHMFQGKAWLVLGVPTSDNLLYQQEFAQMLHNAASDREGAVSAGANSELPLEVTYAISREMVNPVTGTGKCYVQDILAARADELLRRLENGAVIYFCGLKGMMSGILEALEQAALQRRGMNAEQWKAFVSQLKSNGQWHVEVY